MNKRQELAKEVQTRLAAGERKEAIYNALKDRYPAASVERSLAQWPYPADKTKNRFLNVPLLIVVIVFALAKLLRIIGIFQTLEPGEGLILIPLAILTLIIYLYIIYGVLNCNLFGYLLVLVVSINELIGTHEFGGRNLLPTALLAAALGLAWIQKSRLFPNTSWFLRHKKDSAGNIIF